MLKVLRLDNYRSFDSYNISDLARVNLLVGKNNCGKTSILEAAHFLVSRGNPSILRQAAFRRGELNFVDEPRTRLANISHLFFGHRLALGENFRISSDDSYGTISARLVADESSLFDAEYEDSPVAALKIEGNTIKELPLLPVRDDGSLLPFRLPRHLLLASPSPKLPPVQFITPDSLAFRPVQHMWDRVQIEGRESEVINAMKLIEGDLQSIHFLTGDASHGLSSSSWASVLLGFRGGGRRIPLGSYGDGTRRLLALSLSLINSANGFLLIDEIDTGLHWSVMEDMWQFVIAAALRSSVQVFATTHSLDSIRGLASAIESRPDLAPYIGVQKIERQLDHGIHFAAEDVSIAVEQGLEVR